jgi:hypothetical protein
MSRRAAETFQGNLRLAWDRLAEQELLADSCVYGPEAFWFFCRWAFGIDYHPAGGWLNLYHYQLCQMLQREADRWFATRHDDDPPEIKILINAHRGSGKTVIVTKAFGMWLMLRDPNLAIVIDSEKIGKSIEFLGVVKRMYEGKDQHALFTWLFGIWEQPDDWTKAFITHRCRSANLTEPSFGTASVETGATGYHPDVIITDDPLTQEKMKESGMAVAQANTHMDSLVPVLKAGSLQVLVGTPYEDGDPVTSAMADDGLFEVQGLELPNEYEHHVHEEGAWVCFFLPGRDEDGLRTVPRAWSEKKLLRYERNAPADYSAQIMLRPGAGEHIPLTFDQLKEMYIERKDVPFHLLRYTIHSDTAFKDRKRMAKGDESVILVFGHHPTNGDVYFIEGHSSNRWRDEDYIDKLIEIVQRLRKAGRRISWMTDEVSLGGKEGAWRTLLKSCFHGAGMWMPPFEEIKRPKTKDAKTTRITEAAAYWIDGHVHLMKNAPGVLPLMRQMARIGVSKHDDHADAAADTFNPKIYRPVGNVAEGEATQPERGPRPPISIEERLNALEDYWMQSHGAAREPIR